jgi:hypothetical protein
MRVRPYFVCNMVAPAVFTEIELHSVRLLSFDSVAGFLRDIAMHYNSAQVAET